LSEPVAAALAYHLELAGEKKLKEGDSVFIFDLGGGTFDVTIMKIENDDYKVIALGGDSHLGGRDFDRVIADIMEERLRKQLDNDKVNKLMSQPKYRYRLIQAAHEAKESFTQTDKETLSLSDIHPDAEDEELSRKEFEERSQELQKKIKECCEDTLRDAKINAKDINHVLLVGGASRMNMITNILKNIFPPGTNLSKTVSGDEAIAIGATIYAARLLEVSESPSIKELKIKDALPLPIGVESKDSNFSAVLEKNSPLPVCNEIKWKITKHSQTSIEIPIYEGTSKNINENTYIGDIKIEGIPPEPAGKVTVIISLKVDKNGLVEAEAKVKETNDTLDTQITYKMKFNTSKITTTVMNKDNEKYAIGIDLGTANSAVGVWNLEKVELVENEQKSYITPSYAYYSPDGIYIGQSAIEKLEEDPKNVLFDAKRLLAWNIDSSEVQGFTKTWSFEVTGHPDPKYGKAHFVSAHAKDPIPPEKVSADVLKYLLNTACRRLRMTKQHIEAVITVPAYFSTQQRTATMKAAEEAGINVKQLLSEPVAAALAYHLELAGEKKLKDGDSVFIFDLGGGTFDVTIMKIENGIYKVIALGGDSHLGGRDFDRVIADIMEERLRKQLEDDEVNELMKKPENRYKLIQAAHEAKKSFSETDNETLSLSDIHPDAEDEELSRKEFEERSQELQDKIKKCCEDTLSDAKINPKDINHVLLVGGASIMKMIKCILSGIFSEKKILNIIKGKEAVVIGATSYSARLLNVTDNPAIQGISIQGALPLSIGIQSIEPKD